MITATKKCLMCSLSHIKGKNPNLPDHCWGDGTECSCWCTRKDTRTYDALKGSFDAIDRFRDAQERGLVR